jgi:predicted tellurium resistance membrane protein TerC
MPPDKQAAARSLGLGFALITRILLLCSLYFLTRLTQPLVAILGVSLSGGNIVMILGGLFLIVKGTREIHASLEEGREEKAVAPRSSLVVTIAQIMLIDIVLSLDSVITAVGVARQLGVMIAAIVIAVGIMLWASGAISNFVNRNPTVRMLALSFLLLIGMVLIADGFGQDIPRGYVYFAMGFSFAVEMLNLKLRGRRAGTGKN